MEKLVAYYAIECSVLKESENKKRATHFLDLSSSYFVRNSSGAFVLSAIFLLALCEDI